MDGFYAARSRTIPPLPWTNFAPPFSGNGVDQHLSGVIIHDKGDDGFAPGRDGTQSRGDFVAEASLVRRVPQGGNGRFDLGQLPRRDIRPGIVEDPLRDGV